MNRRSFFSRLLGIGAAAAVARVAPSEPYGFELRTPDGKLIELRSAPTPAYRDKFEWDLGGLPCDRCAWMREVSDNPRATSYECWERAGKPGDPWICGDPIPDQPCIVVGGHRIPIKEVPAGQSYRYRSRHQLPTAWRRTSGGLRYREGND